jgi:hypothetical protein
MRDGKIYVLPALRNEEVGSWDSRDHAGTYYCVETSTDAQGDNMNTMDNWKTMQGLEWNPLYETLYNDASEIKRTQERKSLKRSFVVNKLGDFVFDEDYM